jgi:hypothetical protein
MAAAVPEQPEMPPQPAESSLADQPAPTPPSQTSIRTPVLIAGGSSALLAAGIGTYFVIRGVQAREAENAARSAVEGARDPAVPPSSACSELNPPDACGALTSNVDDRFRFNNLAVGAFIGAGVLAGATVATLVLWKDPQPEETGKTSLSTSHLALAVVPVIGAINGLGVSGDSEANSSINRQLPRPEVHR